MPAVKQTDIEFLHAQLKRLNSGKSIEALPSSADSLLNNAYGELLKLKNKVNSKKESEEDTTDDLLEAIDAAVVVYNNKNKIIFYNERYAKLYPQNAEVLKKGVGIYDILNHLSELGLPQQSGLTKEEFFKLRLDNFGKEEFGTIVFIAGKWYSRSTKLLPSGGHITTIKDITHLKQMEEELVKRKEHLRIAIEASSHAIVLVDVEGKVIVVNKKANEYTGLFGYTPIVIGAKMTDSMNPTMKAYFAESIKRVLNGENIEAEREVNLPTGKWYFLVTYSGIKNQEGNIWRIVVSFMDITERRLMQERRMEMIRRRSKMKEEKLKLAALIEGQEIERKRLARDIHDGLGQMLTAIRLQIKTSENLFPKRSENFIKKIQTDIRSAIIETRRIAHDLMPSILEDIGLTAALNSLIEKLKPNTNIDIHLTETNKPSALVDQDSQLKITLYRIVQEALSNVIEHSNANKCFVTLTYNKKNILLSVRDNGTNFIYPLNTKKGIGILSMKERAELLKGKFFIEAEKGNNCHIQVVIPIKIKNGKN